jgi:hypothetical protein
MKAVKKEGYSPEAPAALARFFDALPFVAPAVP